MTDKPQKWSDLSEHHKQQAIYEAAIKHCQSGITSVGTVYCLPLKTGIELNDFYKDMMADLVGRNTRHVFGKDG